MATEGGQGRASLKQVNLPIDTIDTLDAIGVNLAADFKEMHGVDLELTRPQVIAAIAKKVLDQQDEAVDRAEAALSTVVAA
jgi:hypothetical protein